MTRTLSARLAFGLVRFPYVLAWPAGLYYAFLFGSGLPSCLREGANPFSWAMTGVALAALLIAPVTLLVMAVALCIAFQMKDAPGGWRRRLALAGRRCGVHVAARPGHR